jgi:hypothetical protein
MLHNKASPIRCFRLYASAQRARIGDAARNSFLVCACSGSPSRNPLRTPFCKSYLSRFGLGIAIGVDQLLAAARSSCGR